MENEVIKIMENMEEQFHEAAQDAVKFAQGNNSAGTRVRKAMQNIKSLAQAVRLEIQHQKNGVTA